VELEHQLPIEEESGWAPEQSGCYGEEEDVWPVLEPDGCTVESPGYLLDLIFKVISVTCIALDIM
jgi:hypothetical protein